MGNAVPISLGVVGGVVGLALVAWPTIIWWEVRKCEKPKHAVLRQLGLKKGLLRPAYTSELRRYAPFLIAEVTVANAPSMKAALGSGFRQIAGFIFGKNSAAGTSENKVAMTSPVTLEMDLGKPASEKVAMTAPVSAEMLADNTYKVSFVMPSRYTLDTLPKPDNSNVHIREVPARTMAALSWHGSSPREPEVQAQLAELRRLMAGAGLAPLHADRPHVWQYYPPFAPGWLRLNEVLYEVAEEHAASS